MGDPKVAVNITGAVDKTEETAEVTPALGASMCIDMGDAQASWLIDYRKPDRLILTVQGRAKVVETGTFKVEGGGRMTRDVFGKSTSFEGTIRMEFDKDVQVELTAATDEKGARLGAGIKIQF
jgi:hypothetical protein